MPYSTIVVIVNNCFLSREYVDPRVLFATLKWPFTYSKKRGLQLFPFIHVLNFWVPERARVISHDKKRLYVLKFEYIKGSVIKGYTYLSWALFFFCFMVISFGIIYRGKLSILSLLFLPWCVVWDVNGSFVVVVVCCGWQGLCCLLLCDIITIIIHFTAKNSRFFQLRNEKYLV